MRLGHVVEVSGRVGATRSRLEKVERLAALIRRLHGRSCPLAAESGGQRASGGAGRVPPSRVVCRQPGDEVERPDDGSWASHVMVAEAGHAQGRRRGQGRQEGQM